MFSIQEKMSCPVVFCRSMSNTVFDLVLYFYLFIYLFIYLLYLFDLFNSLFTVNFSIVIYN